MLPILYKKTSTGAIQSWQIDVSHEDGASYLVTTYGQLNTPNPQTARDPIREGKNAGRANATTRQEQAVAEAKAKWEKQKTSRGYVESIEAAQAGEVDALVAGGILPMLAHKFAEHAEKIEFPVFVQPKLDGIRCLAILQDGVCTLWTRTRKPIVSCPHIVVEIEDAFPGQTLLLDGELYNHEMKADFERIVSLVRQDAPHPDCELVQYHVYDVPDSTLSARERMKLLLDYTERDFKFLRMVHTAVIDDETGVLEYLTHFRNAGYEGCMLRNAEALYVNKRSYDLQKVKEFDDGEFEIIGIKEGRGRLVGHVGAFICRISTGIECEVKLSGTTDRLREYYENHALWQGKKMTVRYQGLTKKGNLRFPVGVTVRDYE